MSKNFSLTTIVILFIFISFFPVPIHQKYHLYVKAFLILIFAIILIRKRFALLKLNDWPLWFFLLCIGLNVFFAQQKGVAIITYLDLVIPMLVVYYLAIDGLTSSLQFSVLAKTICIASILVSLLGIFESVFAFNPLYEKLIPNEYYHRYISGFVRPMSTQFNPAPLGTYLLGSLPFNFLLFKEGRLFFRLSGALGIVLNIVVIILTFSRGVFLGLLAMIVFYLFTQRNYREILIFLAILLTLIILFSYLPYPFSRIGTGMLTNENRGIFSDYRFDRCIMTKNILKDHPLVGLGFQHFRERFYEYYSRKDSVTYEFMIADNMYLTMLAETGLIGFLGFLVFIVYFLKEAWRQLNIFVKIQPLKLQLLVVLCAFIGLLVNMNAYELLYWPNQYMFFCVIIGCLGVFCKKVTAYED